MTQRSLDSLIYGLLLSTFLIAILTFKAKGCFFVAALILVMELSSQTNIRSCIVGRVRHMVISDSGLGWAQPEEGVYK